LIDFFDPPPKEAKDAYESGRQAFVNDLTAVIGKIADIDTLLENLIGVVPGIECVFVLTQNGETVGVKATAGLPRVKIDLMEIMVHQILEGVTRSFDLTTLGTGVFEIGYLRFGMARAGPTLSIVVISNLRILAEHTLAYSCLAAEKLWRIVDGRNVDLEIPVLDADETIEIKPEGSPRYLGVTSASYRAKLTIVGDEAVGKTSLVRRFVENAFDTDYKPTLGVNISTKTVQFPDTETEVHFSIHDMAGQEQFARVRKAYFRGTSACFIVFDVTNPNSLQTVKSWYKQIREFAGTSTAIILIGNKVDLFEERVVTSDMVHELIRELKCPYIETSAKTGENVETAFSLVAMYLCERSEGCIKTPEQVLTLEIFLREKTLPNDISEILDKASTNLNKPD